MKVLTAGALRAGSTPERPHHDERRPQNAGHHRRRSGRQQPLPAWACGPEHGAGPHHNS